MAKKNRTVFNFLLVLVVIIALEVVGWIAIHYKPDYEPVRKILIGEESFIGLQNMISQPYLLFVPSPNLHKWGYDQNNEFAFRGKSVPLIKEDSVYRILFMGGSTTYTNNVNDPDSSFPAQVGHLLDYELQNERFPKSIKRIEAMNAGLSWGTSAEIMIHYFLKFRYFNADLVVIHTGGNDAYTHFLGGAYQPDYFHFRKTMNDIQPVAKPFRWLFKSRLFSFFLISIFQDDLVKGGQFVHRGDRTRVRWFDPKKPENDPIAHIEFNAFYNNLSTTIREMKHDGAKLLIVPFIGNWDHEQYTDTILQMHHWYTDLLNKIAVENDLPVAPLTAEMITDKSQWMDDCHLNEEGVQIKAEFVSKYIANIVLHNDSVVKINNSRNDVANQDTLQ